MGNSESEIQYMTGLGVSGKSNLSSRFLGNIIESRFRLGLEKFIEKSTLVSNGTSLLKMHIHSQSILLGSQNIFEKLKYFAHFYLFIIEIYNSIDKNLLNTVVSFFKKLSVFVYKSAEILDPHFFHSISHYKLLLLGGTKSHRLLRMNKSQSWERDSCGISCGPAQW